MLCVSYADGCDCIRALHKRCKRVSAESRLWDFFFLVASGNGTGLRIAPGFLIWYSTSLAGGARQKEVGRKKPILVECSGGYGGSFEGWGVGFADVIT